VGLNQRALVGHVTYPCVALEPSTPAETPAHRHAVQSTSGHDTVHCPQFVTQTLVFIYSVKWNLLKQFVSYNSKIYRRILIMT